MSCDDFFNDLRECPPLGVLIGFLITIIVFCAMTSVQANALDYCPPNRDVITVDWKQVDSSDNTFYMGNTDGSVRRVDGDGYFTAEVGKSYVIMRAYDENYWIVLQEIESDTITIDWKKLDPKSHTYNVALTDGSVYEVFAQDYQDIEEGETYLGVVYRGKLFIQWENKIGVMGEKKNE